MRIIAPCATFLLIFGAIATLGADQTAAQTPASDNLAMYRGPDREQRILDGARKEAEVTIYSSMIVDQALRPIVDGFEAKYPFVTAKYVRDDPPQQLQKLMAESHAGHMVADVVESTGLEVPMRAANIDQPFWSPQIAAYPENLRDPQNYWAPTRVSYLGACYNTNLVKPADLPKSFQDFLDPKWKGKMVWSGTTMGNLLFITGVRNFMGEDKAYAYLQQLAKQDIAMIPSANRVIVDRVMAGEYACASTPSCITRSSVRARERPLPRCRSTR
jgi:iron(III) transport system substrate-binding protein